VTRAPGRNGKSTTAVYSGHAPSFRDAGLRPGVAYHYTLRSQDDAGNTAVSKITAKLTALYTPPNGAVVRRGTVLGWIAKPGATYYNLQFFLHGRKVMSVWPVGSSLRIPGSWTYQGHTYRLTRGTYRWYVWPGRGARSKAVYGPLLGSSQFRVR
jgi:hypothetical protein